MDVNGLRHLLTAWPHYHIAIHHCIADFDRLLAAGNLQTAVSYAPFLLPLQIHSGSLFSARIHGRQQRINGFLQTIGIRDFEDDGPGGIR